MRKLHIKFIFFILLIMPPSLSYAANNNIQTFVFVRHGEKPEIENGELTCKGFHRSLKLPKVLLQKFGKPKYIFAPAPGNIVNETGTYRAQMRSLLTIQPTAMSLGLPINSSFKTEDVEGIAKELMSNTYQNSTVFVAWEHKKISDIVSLMYQKWGGNAQEIPKWPDDDFDSIYILKLNDKNSKAAFSIEKEGLDGQSNECEL